MSRLPASGPPDDFVESVTFQARGLDDIIKMVHDLGASGKSAGDRMRELQAVVAATGRLARQNFLPTPPGGWGADARTSPRAGGPPPPPPRMPPAPPPPGPFGAGSPFARYTDPGREVARQQQIARDVEESRRRKLSGRTLGMEDQAGELHGTYRQQLRELARFKREVSDGTFARAAKQAEDMRKRFEAVGKQMALAERQARYGNVGGYVAQYGAQYGVTPGRVGGTLGGMAAGGFGLGVAGLQGTTTGAAVSVQIERVQREFGAAIDPLARKFAAVIGKTAGALGQLTPGQQDVLGGGLVGGAGLFGMSKMGVPVGSWAKAGGRAVMGRLAGMGPWGWAAAAAGYGFYRIGENAQEGMDRRERLSRGLFTEREIEETNPLAERFRQIADPRKRAQVLREEMAANARRQQEHGRTTTLGALSMLAPGAAAFQGNNPLGRFFGDFSVLGYRLNSHVGDRRRMETEQGRLEEEYRKAMGIAPPGGKQEESKHRRVQLSGGGFETLDQTYARTEAGFSRVLAAKADEANTGGASLGAIERLPDILQQLVNYLNGGEGKLKRPQ